MPFVSLPYVKMYYEMTGELDSKFTMLMIHGWTETHKYWVEQVKFFSDSYKIVTLDLKGHGLSSKNRRGYSIRRLSKDIYELKRKLDLQNIILVGHSLGGMVALDYYFRRDRGAIKALILFNTTPRPIKMIPRNLEELQGISKFGIRKFLMMVYDFSPDSILNLDGRRKKEVDELIEDANRTLPLVSFKLGLGSSGFDVSRKLNKIYLPTLLLTGELDNVTPLRIMQDMHERIPNSEFHVIPNTGHMAAIEKSEITNKLIGEFLKKNSFY